ncbi:MAG: MBOAT family protein [Lachnospiraceae bacterium]|nr:MBOAT family protein [Lachnospiraceae bacterium]
MFQSYSFVFLFLPVLLAGWYLLLRRGGRRYALSFLCVMSLLFYASFGIRALLIFTSDAAVTFLISRLLQAPFLRKHPKKRLLLCAAGVLLQLALLLLFKLPPSLRAYLPVGLGFYTLRHIAYLIDLFRDAEANDASLSALSFLLFFPVLAQGPVTLREDMIPQMDSVSARPFRAEALARGLTRFILGLSKKLLIADTIGLFIETCYAYLPRTETLSAAVAVFAVMPQIYFDFSGYCDMADGVSEMLGFSLPLNFDSPLQASSPRMLWRRWHMTLSRFFHRYLYLPLGGSRKGRVRTACNLMLVFLVSGFWHGSTAGYLLWGALAGLPVCLAVLLKDSPFLRPFSLFPQWLNRVLTYVWVSFAVVFFRSPDVDTALTLLRHLFLPVPLFRAFIRVLPTLVVTPESWLVTNLFARIHPALEEGAAQILALLFLAAVIVCLCMKNVRRRVTDAPASRFVSLPFTLLLGFLFLWSVLSFSGVSTFLYFQY